MSHLIISHNTLMSRGTVVSKHSTRSLFTGLHKHTRQWTTATPTNSGFCHVVRKKLLQGSSLTDVFHWTNRKRIFQRPPQSYQYAFQGGSLGLGGELLHLWNTSLGVDEIHLKFLKALDVVDIWGSSTRLTDGVVVPVFKKMD